MELRTHLAEANHNRLAISFDLLHTRVSEMNYEGCHRSWPNERQAIKALRDSDSIDPVESIEPGTLPPFLLIQLHVVG